MNHVDNVDAVLTMSPSRAWESRLRLPARGQRMPQDSEYCEIREGSKWRRLRFHDYHEIFNRPGLYECLYYDLLQCRSPQRVVGLLAEVRDDLDGTEPLRAIDLGAGNRSRAANVNRR